MSLFAEVSPPHSPGPGFSDYEVLTSRTPQTRGVRIIHRWPWNLNSYSAGVILLDLQLWESLLGKLSISPEAASLVSHLCQEGQQNSPMAVCAVFRSLHFFQRCRTGTRSFLSFPRDLLSGLPWCPELQLYVVYQGTDLVHLPCKAPKEKLVRSAMCARHLSCEVASYGQICWHPRSGFQLSLCVCSVKGSEPGCQEAGCPEAKLSQTSLVCPGLPMWNFKV